MYNTIADAVSVLKCAVVDEYDSQTYEYLKTGEVIGKCLSFKDGESI